MSCGPKVAIIGAGLSGLTCAYELAKHGVKATIFESESHVGGRVRNIAVGEARVPVGALMFTPDYTDFWNLVSELGLGSHVRSVSPSEASIFIDGSNLSLSRRNLVLTPAIPFKAKLDLTKLLRRVAGLEAWKFEETLMKISLNDYLADEYSDFVITRLVDPFIRLFFQEPRETAAAIGLRLLKTLTQIRLLEGGNARVTETLSGLLSKQILSNLQVRSISSFGEDGFKLEHETGTENFRFVVSAVPIPVSREIIPNLDSPEMEYADINVLVVRGQLRWPKQWVLVNSDWRELGVNFIVNSGSYQTVYFRTKEPDLSPFFRDYDVLDLVYWKHALPKIKPTTSFPSLRTKIPGLFLCGDFYLGGRMESAVRSGRLVAKMILDQLGIRS